LETFDESNQSTDDLYNAIEHADAHLNFLKVQLWVNRTLKSWEELFPSVVRLGIQPGTDGSSVDFHDQRYWFLWASRDDFQVGVRKNGEWDIVSQLKALQGGLSQEELKPIETLALKEAWMPTPPPPREGLILEGGRVHLSAFPPAREEHALRPLVGLETV
jgi:hypothetical protein